MGGKKPFTLANEEAWIRALVLPPYSPDVNPIEQAFSKLKTLLRKENARAIEGIEQCIARLIGQIDPAECLNYFKEAQVCVNLPEAVVPPTGMISARASGAASVVQPGRLGAVYTGLAIAIRRKRAFMPPMMPELAASTFLQ